MKLGFIQKQALILVQALLGVISSNFRMISIIENNGKIIVTIIIEIENNEDLEEINDLLSEFEALHEAPVVYEFVIQIEHLLNDFTPKNAFVNEMHDEMMELQKGVHRTPFFNYTISSPAHRHS